MPTVDVSAAIRQAQRSLDEVARKQIPFATAQALNATAKVAALAVTRQLPSIFDRPTPFTQRAIGVQPATKSNLTAVVYVKDRQAEYLGLQETGGTRLPTKRAIVVPGGIQLNAYGNMAKGALRRAQGRRKNAAFSGVVHGVAGVWQRLPDHKLKLLAAFKNRAEYKKRFHFGDRVRKVAMATFGAAFSEAFRKAMATRR